MNSATETAPRAAAGLVALLAALLLALAAGARPALALTPADLRDLRDKADKALEQAQRATQGNDPGKVSLLLARADELLGSLLEGSGLEGLVGALDEGRAAARASDLGAARAAVQRANQLMSSLTDYVVLRQAAESSRAAMRAAETGDSGAFFGAVDRFDEAVLAPVLLARVRETRAAIARARQSMVHNNMIDGRSRIGDARRALDGFTYAGALSRGTYSLVIGSELLAGRSFITACDQLQKGLRDLKLASDEGPGDATKEIDAIRDRTHAIWKRCGHPRDEDAPALAEMARTLDALRLKQPR